MRLLTLLAALAISNWAGGGSNPGGQVPEHYKSCGPGSGSEQLHRRPGEIQDRIAGFTTFPGLKKDDNGIWTGSATKGGNKVNVSLDFQGNVNPIGKQT